MVGIPSSLQTERLAHREAIPLTNFSAHPVIDITIDGADEVDARLNLIKGGGGALLREKVLAQASSRNIIMVDPGKMNAGTSSLNGFAWCAGIAKQPLASMMAVAANAREIFDITTRPLTVPNQYIEYPKRA